MSPSTPEGASVRQTQDFMEAVAAVCALMASADESTRACELSSIKAAISTDPAFEPLDGVHRRDAGNDVVDVFVDFREIDIRRHGLDAEPPGGTHDVRSMPRRQHGFGRHAADIEAVPAHSVPLDQSNFGPHACRNDRGQKPC